MAEENKNLQNNADGIPEDIDALLASAGKSLSELSDEVGQEEKEPSGGIELEKDDKVSDVDSILSSLAAELENIGENIDGKSEPSDQSETELSNMPDQAASEPDDQPEAVNELVIESSEDPLADLTAELEKMNGSALKDLGKDQNQQEAPAPASDDTEISVASKTGPAEANIESDEKEESIDDVLARIAGEINEEHLQESTVEEVTEIVEPEDEVSNIVEEEVAEKTQTAESISQSPVESDEAVEEIEEVDSLGDDQKQADAELDELASEVEQVLDGFADAVAEDENGLLAETGQDQKPQEEKIAANSPQPVIDDDIAQQLADLSEMLDKTEPENKTPAPASSKPAESESSKKHKKQEMPEPPISDSEKVMPHAEDVLKDLDKQMSDLNDLVKEETDSADAMDDIVLQELEDKTSPKKAEKKQKPMPFAEETPAKTEKTANRGMNPAQKVFVSGLQATNKPFEKVVPGKAKDTLGLVAIITVAISMATLGFYLVFGGNQY